MDFNYYEAVFPIDFREKEVFPFNSSMEEVFRKWVKLYLNDIFKINRLIFESLHKENRAYYDLINRKIWFALIDPIYNKIDSCYADSLANLKSAYTTSLFPNRYGDRHNKCLIVLLNCGYLPVYNGRSWILYTGKEVVPTYKAEMRGNDNLFIKKLT